MGRLTYWLALEMVMGRTAVADACHHEGRYECEREEHRHVVMPPAETIVAQRGVACQPVESPGDKGKQEDEIEVV